MNKIRNLKYIFEKFTQLFNSMWPSDTIWRHKSGSTVAWQHQAITWTNVDLSWVRSSGLHLRAILQETPQPSVTKISLKITYLKFCSNLPGANELKVNLSGTSRICICDTYVVFIVPGQQKVQWLLFPSFCGFKLFCVTFAELKVSVKMADKVLWIPAVL